MTRRKPKEQNEKQKRLQVTDEAGWTHIIKGSRAQRHQRNVSLNEYLKPLEPPEGLTVDKMKDKFHKFCQHWKESESFKNYKLVLEEGVLASEKVELTRCVCLGLGSLGGRDASMYELVFLYTTLETLGKMHKIVDVYFQDPVFNSLDEDFLSLLGYTICQTPDAFSKLTPTTFLFAPHLESWFCAKALEVAHPLLYVGNDLEPCVEWLDRDEQWVEVAKTFRKFLNVTVSKPMADFDRNIWIHSTRIYWPRSSYVAAAQDTHLRPEEDQEDQFETTKNVEQLESGNQEPDNEQPETPNSENPQAETREPEKPE